MPPTRATLLHSPTPRFLQKRMFTCITTTGMSVCNIHKYPSLIPRPSQFLFFGLCSWKRKSSENWTQTKEQKWGKPGNKATNTLPDGCRKQLSRKQVDDRKWPCHCKFPNQSHNKLYSTITTCTDTSTKDIHKYYWHVYTHVTTHNILGGTCVSHVEFWNIRLTCKCM